MTTKTMNWKCPHCGGTSGTYWSRIEPMDDVCKDCGRGLSEPTIKQNLTDQSETPRTDSVWDTYWHNWEAREEMSEQLELELAASNAEVERLTKLTQDCINCLKHLLKHLGYDARIVNENEDGKEVCEL